MTFPKIIIIIAQWHEICETLQHVEKLTVDVRNFNFSSIITVYTEVFVHLLRRISINCTFRRCFHAITKISHLTEQMFEFPNLTPNTLPQFVICRSSVARRTCSSTRRSTCARRSRTSAPSARRRSRTPRTCPSTPGSTWASSRTAARFASGSSPN